MLVNRSSNVLPLPIVLPTTSIIFEDVSAYTITHPNAFFIGFHI
jgi:hypothetical protein